MPTTPAKTDKKQHGQAESFIDHAWNGIGTW